jgi:hypothetical protein
MPESHYNRFKRLVKLIAISKHLKSLLKVRAYHQPRKGLDLAMLGIMFRVRLAACPIAFS